jgi:hypothetical protein
MIEAVMLCITIRLMILVCTLLIPTYMCFSTLHYRVINMMLYTVALVVLHYLSMAPWCFVILLEVVVNVM